MTYSGGWTPDLPDLRDYDAADLFNQSERGQFMTSAAPEKVDMRQYCSEIEDQGRLGSCVAQAVAGLAEYGERVIYGKHIDVSRLFLYKVARQLDFINGDNGSRVRTCMKALRLFGAPPEKHWPYDITRYDLDPPAMVFAYGQNLQATMYYRLDRFGRSRSDVLSMMKRFIEQKRPVAFGFRVFSYGNSDGEFPMPDLNSRPKGGHAVMAVGYDDGRKIGPTAGALLIRNSWGKRWGQDGYGWLPYAYVTHYLSHDFWILIRKENVMD